jgi:glycyl-tRNA synthetase beta chain
LRRAANAIVKILAVAGLPLTLGDVLNASSVEGENEAQVKEFLRERVQFYLKEVRGFAYDVVNAVLAVSFDDVRDAIARAEALTAARGSEDFVAVSAAFKRIKNILRQAAEKGELAAPGTLAESALTQPEERKLLAESMQLAPKVAELREQRNYAAALEAIATLRPTVDAFFDKIMVMAPEPELRAARLGLIQSVLDGFSGIADFSEIVVA